jgi:hypothetical protein
MKIAPYCLVKLLFFFLALGASAQRIAYSDPWSDAGVKVYSSGENGIAVDFSIHEIVFENIAVDGQTMKNISLQGSFLFNDMGCPNLPGNGHYIAIPQGATPKLKITASRVETIGGLDIVPAPGIPKETEPGPVDYTMNPEIYSKDAFYPAQPVTLSTPSRIRGVDVVLLGITPFQYNPVTKELKIYRDLKVEVTFELHIASCNRL